MGSQRSNLFTAPTLGRGQAEMSTQAEEMHCEGRICVPLIRHLYFSEVSNLIELHPGRLF